MRHRPAHQLGAALGAAVAAAAIVVVRPAQDALGAVVVQLGAVVLALAAAVAAVALAIKVVQLGAVVATGHELAVVAAALDVNHAGPPRAAGSSEVV